MIIAQAKQYCIQYVPNPIPITVGKMWGKNSILVTGELEAFKAQITRYFYETLHYEVAMDRRGATAHIDIHGNQEMVRMLAPTVDLENGWSMVFHNR